MYKALCDIMPCRIASTDISEPSRGQVIFITLYLIFLRFVIDYSESKVGIVLPSISIMKYDRL